MFFRIKKTGAYGYLQIVASVREGKKVRQRVLTTLGRIDFLEQSGQLNGLIRSGARFCDQLAVIDAHDAGKTEPVSVARIGPDLIFGRLWEETAIKPILSGLLEDRRYLFDVERAVYLTVLHRLFASGSDRAAEQWREQYRIPGTEQLDLHHLYRAMAWLGEPLGGKGQGGILGSPRCIKDVIEEALFERRRDLFSEIDLVFFDTTSIYFEGNGGQSLGQRGHSKDSRPDLKQMVVGLALDAEGWPLCCEMWPGNTTDVKTLLPVVRRLKERFRVNRVSIVSDRGMISKSTVATLESDELDCDYILGVRMRSSNEANEVVRCRGVFDEVYPERKTSKDPSPLKVKEVVKNGRRYIVCVNQEQKRKDAADREAIVTNLRQALKAGDKSLVGNKGYRKFLRTTQSARFEIDEDKVRDDARFDGTWVLQTSFEDLDAETVAMAYKQLWMVEQLFRTMKSILETRPIYHRSDETIRGHVFCSFLAIVLKCELEKRLRERDEKWEWAEVIRGVDSLNEVETKFQGKRYALRSQMLGQGHKAFLAAGVAMPPTLRELR